MLLIIGAFARIRRRVTRITAIRGVRRTNQFLIGLLLFYTFWILNLSKFLSLKLILFLKVNSGLFTLQKLLLALNFSHTHQFHSIIFIYDQITVIAQISSYHVLNRQFHHLSVHSWSRRFNIFHIDIFVAIQCHLILKAEGLIRIMNQDYFEFKFK